MIYLTATMAAKRLHIDRATVYNWIHKGKLSAYKLPGKRGLRVREDTLDHFVEERYSFRPRSRVEKLVEIGEGR